MWARDSQVPPVTCWDVGKGHILPVLKAQHVISARHCDFLVLYSSGPLPWEQHTDILHTRYLHYYSEQ